MASCRSRSKLPDAYSNEDQELFLALASVAALAVQNSMLVNDLRRSHADLSDERASLAHRVEERTTALRAANAELARAACL